MGLLDMLEGAAGAAQSQPSAGSQEQGVVAAVISMLQAQPGGIAGIVQKFESVGLGGVAQSWIANGANQTVSPEQVQSALGDPPVGQVANQLGVSPGEAAGHIAQLLPMILDHLSPSGEATAGGGLGELGGVLSRFTQAR
jgi:uncharacterized protein YidB (DUF937 family)